MPYYIIILLLLAPILAVILLRANSALVFAATCIGFAATHFVSSHEIGVQLAPYIGPAKDSHIQILLAFLPAVVVLIATLQRRSKGLFPLLINLLPAIGVGYLSISMALPFLSEQLRTGVLDSGLWQLANGLQGPIVALATVLSLFILVTNKSSRRVSGD